ncbi:proto-oncogene tyrosine-protein kinase receptor Ret-like [Schistocerca americana]|uniref:proto-oncogene tyrosine-protein kinase receptor Ret-like n=1 Tax=Schistocerca americana TaxID=7009 RepID=UPI001F4F92A0|nr:proto-oncogene tyrosine-protein kinase receptor Ret-like [Schistocerca americana]
MFWHVLGDGVSRRCVTAAVSQLVLVVVLPTVSFVVAAALAAAMMYQRCGCAGWLRRKLGEGRLRPVYSCRGVYKAVSIDSSSSRITRVSFPALQERSILYVEKEIEEAKARGEVDTFEVSYERLQLGRQIGKGDFGRVFLARAEAVGGVPGWRTVAVKKLKLRATAEEVEEFQAEIAMLKHAGRHPNVVEMVGCCTLRPPLCILMEFVPCGDLLHYLRRLRVEYERRTGAPLPFSSTRARDSESSYVQPDPRLSFSSSGRPSIAETEWSLVSSEGGAPSTPTERSPCPGRLGHGLDYVLDPAELQSFAVQIARGMAHLEQRHITHRDLAARNILIDEHKTLKISDFGLSRSGIYVNTRGKKVPLRWLSVEAIRDNLYSSKSDVWAYAIVLWEIGTLGGFPYPTVSDHDLLRFLLEGRRLEKPDNCTDELYSLMMMCWSHNADDRPSFATISKHLEGALGRRPVYVDFSNLSPDYTFPPTEQQQQQHQQQQQQQRPSFRMYSLMMMCWSHNADDRPSFATISKHLEGALGRRPVYVDFSNLSPDYTFPPTEQQQQQHQQQQRRPSFRM